MKKTLFLFAAIMVAHWASAQWDGTTAPITQGSGTENDPYLINTPQQLAYMSDMVAGGIGSYQSAYYLLTQNISLSNQPWAPIGDNLHSFSGHFDGGGHTIDSVSVSSTYTKRGFFGVVQSGTIQNIILNVNIGNSNTGNNADAGGVAGSVYSGIVQNCKVYGSVAGYNAGGIVGICSGTSIIYCENHASVRNLYYGGGIMAYNSAGSCSISNCGNYGNVVFNSYQPHYAFCGGIVGFVNDCSIEMCYNCGNVVINTTLQGNTVHNVAYAAGISGRNGTINKCYNIGNISVTASNNYTYAYNADCFIYGIGGTIGDGCYNIGQLTHNGSYVTPHIYSVAQSCGNNNYYLNTVIGEGCGMPRAESNMKSMSFPAMLNDDSTVYVMDELGINDGYPVFAYQTVYNITTNNASNVTSYTAALNGHYGGTADSAGFIFWQQGGRQYCCFTYTI